MGAVTNQDRNNVRKLYRKIKDGTDLRLDKRGEEVSDEMRKVVATENTIRSCLEVIINECVPYGEMYVAELTTRLASYLISSLPIERQQDIMESVITHLPEVHARRMRDGIAIKTQWVSDGVQHPNIPEKGDVQ